MLLYPIINSQTSKIILWKAYEGNELERINVTKSFMPPLEEYEAYLRQIWESSWLTNQGPLLQEFEKQMTEYLGARHFQFVSNGTTALQLALRALAITDGEVITTPFSYVATTSAILWERCTPVFVDINPETLCIDVEQLEAAITPRTKAIMPVHVFGFPCDVEKIDALAKKHQLKVIYDAAHAVGVTYNGTSLMNYGDISICSFHSTKLLHTIEGGGMVMADAALNARVDLLKRFGHDGDDHKMLGINAKTSEFNAAMGLCNLGHIDAIVAARKQKTTYYDGLLKVGWAPRPLAGAEIGRNYAYYPRVFDTEQQTLDIIKRLNKANIFPRRYFYPSLNELPYLDSTQSCPVSEGISRRIICLPLYVDLDDQVIERICEIINA
jgi:dTDP-4-amino-4,6-dideoxygalactose transaminase